MELDIFHVGFLNVYFEPAAVMYEVEERLGQYLETISWSLDPTERCALHVFSQ